MRTQSMPAALLGFSMLTVIQPSAASTDLLEGSYSADGACYCLGSLNQSFHQTLVPTPIGGQTVKQICEQIGSGPELNRSKGLFNYPVYPDSQCGHGPGYAKASASDDCLGSLHPEAGDCQGIGPKWDLQAAYSSHDESTTETVIKDTFSDKTVEPVRETTKASLLTAPVVTSAVEKSADGKQLKATVIRSASTVAHDSTVLPDNQVPSIAQIDESIVESIRPSSSSGSPAGRTVIIDGQAYRQARSDLSANSGEPGSRIILDNLVFLRDDGDLAPDDLYKGPLSKPVARTVVASESTAPVESSVTSQQAPAVTESDDVRRQRLLAEARTRLRVRQGVKTPDLTPSTLPAPAESETLAQDTDDTSLLLPSVAKANEPTVAAASESTKKLEQEDTSVAVKESVDSVGNPEQSSGLLSALRLPPAVRASNRDFDYFDAIPTGFDFGGGGVVLEASADSHGRFHYLGRVGVVADYQEVLIGGGYYLTPRNADRMTVVLTAGLEYGTHEWSDEPNNVNAQTSDAGVFLGLSSRMVINSKFELQAGAGYSSFFEGDPMLFGRGLLHINRQLDLVSRFELGDNDSLGLGIRYYY